LRIVAIGGGSFNRRQTWRIDRQIVAIAADHPHVLFLPTAMNDDPEQAHAFHKLYGDKLGCEVHVLNLVHHPPSQDRMKSLIEDSDIIYAGPGNTLRMLNVWRSQGMDVLLRRAATQRTVMCGLSAGAIAWFAEGHSDFVRYKGEAQWSYERVKGLGLIDALFCPHYHTQKREEDLARMVIETGRVAIACDDDAAFAVEDDMYRVLPVSAAIMAYRIFPHNKKAVCEPLPADGIHRPLNSLLGNVKKDEDGSL